VSGRIVPVGAWSRIDDAQQAADAILDVAGELFATTGPAAATVSDVARAAGCSRQTVHRYFATGDALRAAFVAREASTIRAIIATRLVDVTEPDELLVRAVREMLAEVRARPALRRWFEPDAVGTTVLVSSASETVADSVGALWDRAVVVLGEQTGQSPAVDRATAIDGLRRLAVSLLTDPPADDKEVERLVRAMVVPMLRTEPLGPRS
jgi:AcrR family transcriptional regulator